MNRFTWDLRHDNNGPLAVPGLYRLRLSGDGWNKTQALSVMMDPRLAKDGVTLADLEEQLALNLQIQEMTNEARLHSRAAGHGPRPLSAADAD